MNKKKIIIIIISTIVLLLISIVVFILIGLSAVSDELDYVNFEIKSGTSRFDITKDLKDAGIIKSEFAANIYILINFNMDLQAGTYKLNRQDSAGTILNQISDGNTNIYDETINVTFVEGKRITYYAKTISESFGYDYEEVLSVFKDKDYASSLVNKYQFLTDEILDDEIYYPLEGYLFPDTYQFYSTSSVKEIIEKLLDQTAAKLSSVMNNITDSGKTIHEILTVASIAETEGLDSSTRQKVSQVVYSRLSISMPLGMDVTSYYGVQKEIGEILTYDDLNAENGYNTRNPEFLGLPIGPICSPSFESITSALNPSDTSYLYFVADVTTGEVFFFETISGFESKVIELRNQGKL